MKNFKSYFLIATIAALFNSCAKDGATGPAGPQGAQGSAGNANVKEQIFTVYPNQWSLSGNHYYYQPNDADITNASIDQVTAVFSSDSLRWQTFPYSNFLVNGDYLSYSYITGQIDFRYYYSSAPAQTLYFKVTVIPAQ
jgi:hypothetical protein